ncbi:bifunctional (p)ppGpp synthetase/guanosine-3',5'-bis(diphosphate) 3'-pyrophosphohydrolase [candidate division KSB1 bacterium]|nr:bifunctional (p)ppGpp synthetase/guanosine-3',5'-bis(diphosphate) 3'-pyrophosphohydrolase [candidate division KSB1 bacterium]
MEAIAENYQKPSKADLKAVKTSREPVLATDPKVRRHYRDMFNRIVQLVRGYSKNPDVDLLKKAYQFAYEAHIDQLRLSGLPYIEHCLETFKILAQLKMDVATLAVGLLHDVVEDTGITIEQVREEFGDEIALLVDGVTKISELKFDSVVEKQAENFRKMIFSMSQDLRVIMIKFADRLHNMRTIEFLPKKKAQRIALETREIYAPLAHRFGIAQTKWELEDLALKILSPQEYYELVHKISGRREERERYIHKMATPIRRELAKNQIECDITGRPKSIFSIYRKMEKRNRPFEEIYDLLAIRIVVQKVDECYFALGVVHTLFTPVHDRFKDYIATPKLNMYQSLHTTVIGSDGKMVEIQIRTEEMHRISEIGIAAHWKYKEGKKSEDELDRYSAWLREMIDWQKDSADPEEYMNILKTDLFRSEIFVFTPKGDLFKLPLNSTPIDFAYAVHTDVGFHCIGAKVNGRIVALGSTLKNGDAVEILTSANQRPHHDWLNLVQTSKAMSRIRKYIKETQLQEAVKLGEEILSKSLRRYHIKASIKDIRNVALKMKKDTVEQFYADLGQGVISIQKIIETLSPEKMAEKNDDTRDNIFNKFVSRARGSAKGVRVQGMDQFMIRFARCCHPVPGDPIIGFITRGRGIVVHRSDCTNAAKLTETPERNIDVSWDVETGTAFIVQLRVLATGRKDFLKDVAESLTQMNTNIIKIDMKTENSLITFYLILEVQDLQHLTKIIRRLYRIKGILSVTRDSGAGPSLDATQ